MGRLGVGKSGGCRNCRRRKVKCDERRPGCERCERTRKQCEGYIREHRFVDESPRVDKYVRKKVSPAPTRPASSTVESRDVALIAEQNVGFAIENMGFRGLEENIFISFLLSNLFSGIPNSTPWLHLHAEDSSSVSAQLSVRALGTLFFGRAHHQNDITARGYDLYGQALRSLNRDLQDAEQGRSLAVVKSAMALEIYEFIAFSSSSGWIKHAGGVSRLIELRGPWLHQSQREREIFEANRAIIALECLVRRKRCCFESHEWKTIPWALEPEAKTSTMYLHDILCDLPGLMEDADLLKVPDLSGDDFFARHLLLSRKILLCLRDLYEWRASWQEQNSNSCWEVPSSEVWLFRHGPALFPVVFHYASLVEANEITTYSAMLLLLLRLGHEIIGLDFDPSIPATKLPTLCYDPLLSPEFASDPRAVAIEICKSVEYHLGEGRRRAGAFFLLFPMRVAWQVFRPDDPEAVWLKGIMEMIADSTGFEISRGLSGKKVVEFVD